MSATQDVTLDELIGRAEALKLHNLEQLPDDVCTVVCFPVKIARASAGWTRAVARVDDD
jgi:kynurenine formamidase